MLDLLLSVEVGGIDDGASLVPKTIRGRRYWYVQRRESGKKVQRYLGPETPEVVAMVERSRRRRSRITS